MDTLYQAETYTRQVLITDDNGDPYDPADLLAVWCPDVEMTVTNTDPGTYLVTLDEDTTAGLCPGYGHWEMWGRVGSDADLLVYQQVTVHATCARGLAS